MAEDRQQLDSNITKWTLGIKILLVWSLILTSLVIWLLVDTGEDQSMEPNPMAGAKLIRCDQDYERLLQAENSLAQLAIANSVEGRSFLYYLWDKERVVDERTRLQSIVTKSEKSLAENCP